MSSGLTVAGERYILVRNDPGVTLMLKKGLTGLVASKANQCKINLRPIFCSYLRDLVINNRLFLFAGVFIAIHGETTKPEITLTQIGKVIDYLSKHGY
jgi:hypothetical protein